MNYYERHIGDYLKDTAHLSLLEHGIYTRLMDVYYTRESAIPASEAARLIGARTKDEREALATVLAEFFVLAEGTHRQERCEREIAAYHETLPDREARRENDRERQRRARERRKHLFEELRSHDIVPPFDAKTSELEAMLSRATSQPRSRAVTPPVTRDNTATHTQTQYPIEEPISDEAKASSSSAQPTKHPPCPYDAVVQAYHDALPTLPKVRLMDEKRKAAMRKRWAWVLTSTKGDGTRRATTPQEALHWLREFFGRAGQNAWLTGQQPSRSHPDWKADFDFLLNDRGLKAVLERTEVPA